MAVLAAATLFGPPGCSLADPGAGQSTAAFTIPFPGPLKAKITELENEAKNDKSKEQKPAKKAWILNAALADLLPQPFTSETALSGLKYPGDYRFDTSKKESDPAYFPKYFSDDFKGNNTVNLIPEARGHYDYRNDELWVDFANHELGGGVFGNGMVQEETMALTMPQLADAAAIGYYTRSQGKPGVLGSNPTPLVLTKVNRSIELGGGLYKDGWETMTLDQIKKTTQPQNPNQHLNVLAVAVEKVDGSQTQQFALNTMEDMFNTFVASFTLAKDIKPGTTINTGPIGTGDFKNDPKVVYVMQNLAAQLVGGITLRYWGFDPKDPKKQQQDYDPMVTQILGKWKKDADKKTLNLLLIAHSCLTGKAGG
ncbi:hypothetical protein [Mycobacterium sp. 94-17]|uniref:hypothetical protein n=1 Tax=Mycobacterium sp. 94-17 TaxID=2986147 RepID=UPI002D1E86C4|nr:hypothetical protein [Mycobacterium sp. 94-17]MEB4211366.1 hypothetical protein [Mycobacterium sp. 94-17]